MQSRSIAFVCLHGAAKSVVAAELCRRLGAKRGLRLETSSSGPEPDAEIPSVVVEGLLGDGIDVSGKAPERLNREGLAAASHIVSFGVDLTAMAPAGATIERWDECPAVTENYVVARDFIVSRLDALLGRLEGR
jgi:protein-tyrosine-phosphatase